MPRPQADVQILKFAISEDLGDTYPHVIVSDLKTKCKHPVVELGEYKKKMLPELSYVGLVQTYISYCQAYPSLVKGYLGIRGRKREREQEREKERR